MAYYMIRPARETFLTGQVRPPPEWLFTATLLAMLLVIPGYAWLAGRLRRTSLVHVVYHFFVSHLVLFWLASRVGSTDTVSVLGMVFFVWLSVFNMLVVSLFWSFTVDVFSVDQGVRLFGLIAGGGTAGGIVGSLVTSAIIESVGSFGLMLLAAGLLEVCVFCSWRLHRSTRHGVLASRAAAANVSSAAPQAWAGLVRVFKSPYLAGILAMMILFSFCGTTVYLGQIELVAAEDWDGPTRTRFFAFVDLAVNVVTIVIQTSLVGWLVRWIGLGATLTIVPAIYIVGFATLGAHPVLVVCITLNIAQRLGAFAIGVPSRELLFSVVERNEKYQAKGFIDTVGKRFGDAVMAHAFVLLRGAQLSLSAIAWLVVPIAALFAVLSWRMGRWQSQIRGRL